MSSKRWREFETSYFILISDFSPPEFWLGLKTLSNITSTDVWELQVSLEDFCENSYSATYHQFKVEPGPLYKLNISGYNETASNLQDTLTGLNGAPFSTKDRDNDKHQTANCAEAYLGAWWYTACHSSNLNGYNYNRDDLPENPTYYAKGIIWRNEKNVAEQDYYFSWPKVEMKIRKRNC